MLKPCSVIYFSGTGGNFLRLCLSLSKETVPHYYKHLDTYTDLEIYSIRSMSAKQRQSIIQLDSLETFKNFHRVAGHKNRIDEVDFYYKNPLVNNHFDWTIVSNHPDNYHDRLSWLKKILYIELDFEKYGHWIKNAGAYFKQFDYVTNFTINHSGTYLLTQDQQIQVAELKNQTITTTISMSKILDSTDGFVQQYNMACESLNITPELDAAIDYYQKWRQFRVDPFI
jgi:hypothetical protein